MTDRITVTTGGVSATVAPIGLRAARYIVAGQTEKGPVDGPRIVRSLAEYQAVYGARSGGANLYDAAEFFLSNGGSELVVQRAFGPSAVKATASLSSGAIVVTSRNPGAYYNTGWTAAYTSGTTTLTIVKAGLPTVTYTGATAAALAEAASVDPDVTVTVASLPGGNVTATALAGGTDDFANVAWATVLGMVPASVGSGAIAVPGVAGAATALSALTGFCPLLSTGAGDTASAIVSAQGSQAAPYVAGWISVPNGAGGRKLIDPVSFAATVRAVAMNVYGIGTSALNRAAANLANGDVRLVADWGSADVTSLQNAGCVVVRGLANGPGIDNWSRPAGVGGNAALKGLQFLDMVNAVADQASVLLDNYVGLGASGRVMRGAEAALAGMLQAFRPWLTDFGDTDPGFRVSVDGGSSPSDNRIVATIRLQFVEGVEWITLNVFAASADQSI